MSTRIWYDRIKYSMRDLISDVITCCVWSCDTGKINTSDKIMFENQKKKRKYGNKCPSKISFRHRIHSLLKRADARGSADIIYRIWRISRVCGSGTVRLKFHLARLDSTRLDSTRSTLSSQSSQSSKSRRACRARRAVLFQHGGRRTILYKFSRFYALAYTNLICFIK